MQRLPLFPLGVVLVPGQVLAMRFFEPRYRQLLADLLAKPAHEQTFCIVTMKEGHDILTDDVRALYRVGCVAQISRTDTVTDPAEPIPVIVTGQRRVYLHGLDADSHTPYLQGFVSYLLDEPGDEPAALAHKADEVFSIFAALRSARGEAAAQRTADNRILSYLMTAAAPLDLADRVGLLNCRTTSERFDALKALLRRELMLFHTTGTIGGHAIRHFVTPN